MENSGDTLLKTVENGIVAYRTLENWLKKYHWNHQQIEDTHAFWAPFSRFDDEIIRCVFKVDVENEHFVFYVILDKKVDSDQRPVVAEYLTRANFGLPLGNFELDFESGAVRYKSSLDFAGETLTENLIENAISPAVHTMERYMQGLEKVLNGTQTPVEAVQMAEERST